MPVRPPHKILGPLLLERDAMTSAIAATIDHTFQAADAGCVGNAGEVDRLVYFFLEGLPLLEDLFNRRLMAHGIRATLSGIFCHQTPKVQPDRSLGSNFSSCELGDILFLVTYGKRLSNNILGNALLVQAKEDNIGGPEESIQAFLYEVAQEYRYTSPGVLSGHDRSLEDGHYALWYWLFNVSRNQARPNLRYHTSGRNARWPGNLRPMAFEHTLIRLIMGYGGRRFRALKKDSKDVGWSKIVDDLLRVTAISAFQRQNAYVSRNREPLRGEDAARAINTMIGSPAPFLIRSSLKRIFSIFDKEIAVLGSKLERIGKNFKEDGFQKNNEKRYFNEKMDSGKPPILGNERPSAPDNDHGGCSFIIMDFSEVNNE